MHKSSFMPMVLGYIPRSEGYIPLFFQGTIVLGTVVVLEFAVACSVLAESIKNTINSPHHPPALIAAFLAGKNITFFFRKLVKIAP